MFKDLIRKVTAGNDLTEQESALAMEAILNGEATDSQLACLVTALKMKGETAAEITGFARVMKDKSIKINSNHQIIIDTCGTGGDSSGSFNISTTSALVVAASGLPVAKHGNRAVSSSCGSADLLEGLGVNIDIPSEQVAKCLTEIKIGFLFAPLLHQAMKHAAAPRKEMGIRTVFNVLGPLTNPAGANRQLLGVYDPNLTETMAMVLANLGVDKAWVVHGMDGLDEITTCTKTKISELNNGSVKTFYLDPQEYGFSLATKEDLYSGNLRGNLNITRNIINGQKGHQRDIVLLNAAVALYLGETVNNIEDGIKLAAKSIDSGAVAAKLEELKNFTREVMVN